MSGIFLMPISQRLTVLRSTPRRSARAACDSPSLERIFLSSLGCMDLLNVAGIDAARSARASYFPHVPIVVADDGPGKAAVEGHALACDKEFRGWFSEFHGVLLGCGVNHHG